MTELSDAREKVASTIADSLGELVTNWVLVATTITDEGESSCWTLTQQDQAPWTTLGLLEWAKGVDDREDDE